MLELKVSNQIIMSNCTPEIITAAKKALTIPNPSYHRVLRLTGSRWAAQRDFKYYTFDKLYPTTITLPRGFLSRVKDYLEKTNTKYKIKYDFVSDKFEDKKIKYKIVLRDYQIPICDEALKEDCGVIDASVGSGKTIMACEFIKRTHLKTTIIVPTTPIQAQFKTEIEQGLSFKPGIINAKTKEIKDITVTTWQSLTADPVLCGTLARQTGMLIIDESHGIPSPTRIKILNKFHPERLYGFSGSPRRSKDDGRTEAINFLLGPILVHYESKGLIPEVNVIRTGCDILVSNQYHEMIDEMVRHDNRNTLVAGLAIMEALAGKKVLILTKRIEHYKLIRAKLPESDTIFMIDSKDKERNELLLKMRKGTTPFNIILGTTSLLGAGVDIPALDTLIICSDLKSDVLVQQGAGRILRLFEGKTEAKIYDLHDEKNFMLHNQFLQRLHFYKAKNWKVVF